MKKILCLLTVLLLCVNLAVPVFATEDAFVPSITYKPEPELVPVVDEDGNPVVDEDGNEYIGVVVEVVDDEVISYVATGCLEITPIAHVWDPEEEVPEDVEDDLLTVYDGLKEGTMEIPYQQETIQQVTDLGKKLVVRDLFDARWCCHDHPEMVAPKGITVKLTFDMGVMPDAELIAHSVDEQTGEWDEAVEVVNNQDGTITVELEHLCVVAISMAIDSGEPPVEEGPNMLWWIILLIIAVIALLFFLLRKKKDDEEQQA